MSEPAKTVDFGAPADFGAHVFRVEIAASKNEAVYIIEDYGHRGLEGGILMSSRFRPSTGQPC